MEEAAEAAKAINEIRRAFNVPPGTHLYFS
jgi:hypothetical protein